MSSLNRVLRNAVLSDESAYAGPPEKPRRLSSLVGDTFSEAYERGKRDGLAEGLRAGDQAVSTLGVAIDAAIRDALVELRESRRDRTARLVDEAIAIAEFIAGRQFPDAGDRLVPRLESALEALDDGPLTVRVSEADIETVSRAVSGNPAIAVTTDASLMSGEALVSGTWAEADLTLQAAVDAAREALA